MFAIVSACFHVFGIFFAFSVALANIGHSQHRDAPNALALRVHAIAWAEAARARASYTGEGSVKEYRHALGAQRRHSSARVCEMKLNKYVMQEIMKCPNKRVCAEVS